MVHGGAMVHHGNRGKGDVNLMLQYVYVVHLNKPLMSSKRIALVLGKY